MIGLPTQAEADTARAAIELARRALALEEALLDLGAERDDGRLWLARFALCRARRDLEAFGLDHFARYLTAAGAAA